MARRRADAPIAPSAAAGCGVSASRTAGGGEAVGAAQTSLSIPAPLQIVTALWQGNDIIAPDFFTEAKCGLILYTRVATFEFQIL